MRQEYMQLTKLDKIIKNFLKKYQMSNQKTKNKITKLDRQESK